MAAPNVGVGGVNWRVCPSMEFPFAAREAHLLTG